MTTCTFSTTVRTCGNAVVSGYRYCQDHLEYLTRINTQLNLYNCISEQLGIYVSDISDEDSFVDDLGADSLDTVELVMALEEIFEFSIPDKDAEKITTVRQTFNYLFARLLVDKTYILTPASSVTTAFDAIRREPSKIKREINTILSSALFSEYLAAFGLQKDNALDVIYSLIHGNWIEHVTTVPQLSKQGNTVGAYVIFLTKQYLYILEFQDKRIHVNRMRNYEVDLDIDCHYEGEKLVTISVKLFYSRNGFEKRLNFDFTNDIGVSGASVFLNKFYSFLDGAKWQSKALIR